AGKTVAVSMAIVKSRMTCATWARVQAGIALPGSCVNTAYARKRAIDADLDTDTDGPALWHLIICNSSLMWRHLTRRGLRTLLISGPMRAGCIYRWYSICSRARWWDGP